MRMSHYYLVLACLLAPALLATGLTGLASAPGTAAGGHLVLGFTTAILCVATNTLLILFMIVSGRVLRAAMRSRSLAPEFLGELNEFFARRRAYPMALVGAFLATSAAVLGYGRFIGVPPAVHILVGLSALVLNALALPAGLRTLRSNQELLDRVTQALDRADAAGLPVTDTGEPAWSFSVAARWRIFALSAWGPYLYWGLVVWRGDFTQLSPVFTVGTMAASGLALALSLRRGEHTAR
jgi:hypothetical protein